jgi:hypothetical protein
MSKGICIQKLNEGKSLRVFPDFVNDKEVVLIAVNINGLNLRYASPQLKDDSDVVSTAIREHIQAFEFASPRLKGTKDIVMECIKRQTRNSTNSGTGIVKGDNKGYNILVIPIHLASDIIKADIDVIMAAVSIDGLLLQFASETLQSNKNVGMIAVTNDGMSLQWCSDGLKTDEDVLTAAIKEDGMALSFTRLSIIRRDLCILALESNPEIFRHMPFHRNDKELALLAVSDSGSKFEHTSGEGLMLEFVSDNLKKNRDVVTAAVTFDGMSLLFAHETLQDDDVIVMTAIKENGMALQFASPKLKKRRDIVIAAVTQNEETGPAILDADPIFKDDLDMLMLAIEHDGGADMYEYASHRCKMEVGLIKMLYEKEGPGFLENVAEEAWANPTVLNWATTIDQDELPHNALHVETLKNQRISNVRLPAHLQGHVASFTGINCLDHIIEWMRFEYEDAIPSAEELTTTFSKSMKVYNRATLKCKMDIPVINYFYKIYGKQFLERVPPEAWNIKDVLDWALTIPEAVIPDAYLENVQAHKVITQARLEKTPRNKPAYTMTPRKVKGGRTSRKRNKNKKLKN